MKYQDLCSVDSPGSENIPPPVPQFVKSLDGCYASPFLTPNFVLGIIICTYFSSSRRLPAPPVPLLRPPHRCSIRRRRPETSCSLLLSCWAFVRWTRTNAHENKKNSPTAEAVFKQVTSKAGAAEKFDIDSCGTGGGSPNW